MEMTNRVPATTTPDIDIRPARTYRITLSDISGGDTAIDITIPAGTEAEQDAAAIAQAEDEARAWVADSADCYRQDGEAASVKVYMDLSDEQSEWPRAFVTVDVDADHARLIHVATSTGYGQHAGCGDDPDDHDWTREGEGGCDENPGVWSTGGTSHLFRSHCTRCGLIRIEETTGSQRNPGECDTVTYEMPDGE